MAPYAAVNYIRYGMNYEEYLQEYAKARRMKPEELTDILDEIQDGCRPFKTVEAWYEHLTAYKERLLEQRGKRSGIRMQSRWRRSTVRKDWNFRRSFW